MNIKNQCFEQASMGVFLLVIEEQEKHHEW